MRMSYRFVTLFFFFVGLLVLEAGVMANAKSPEAFEGGATPQTPAVVNPRLPAQGNHPVQALLDFHDQRKPRREILAPVESHWEMGFVPMILDIIRILPPNGSRERRLWRLLETRTGQKLPRNSNAWLKWMWRQEFKMHPQYPAFKAALYARIDERFRWWFYPGMKHTIRLDEILWGGVKVDGIPPLEHPKFIEAREATYLGKKNIVFGIFLQGEARAYPKRILAWHELFDDTIGGRGVACAYCTLCGSAVLYNQRIGSQKFDFGTSGFLYRSNKLMYDRQTRSLWSSLKGVPVTGKLVGSGLKLNRLAIVTTTWEAWKQRHPQTKVLSLETGYDRDYGEGVAYRDYFATQNLMFPVPFQDKRLKNKQEVVALLLNGKAVAYDVSFLKKHPLYLDSIGNQSLVILTNRSWANRVYDATGVSFSSWDQKSKLIDKEGQRWEVREEALIHPSGKQRRRLPSHRAFWFGWHAQFPNSRLVH